MFVTSACIYGKTTVNNTNSWHSHFILTVECVVPTEKHTGFCHFQTYQPVWEACFDLLNVVCH